MQVQKLQSIIASRACQYSHDAKRKEREATKLKERLSQLLVDRKEKKLGTSSSDKCLILPLQIQFRNMFKFCLFMFFQQPLMY